MERAVAQVFSPSAASQRTEKKHHGHGDDDCAVRRHQLVKKDGQRLHCHGVPEQKRHEELWDGKQTEQQIVSVVCSCLEAPYASRGP